MRCSCKLPFNFNFSITLACMTGYIACVSSLQCWAVLITPLQQGKEPAQTKTYNYRVGMQEGQENKAYEHRAGREGVGDRVVVNEGRGRGRGEGGESRRSW